MAIQFPPAVQELIADQSLVRDIQTALRPKQLFRALAAVREQFEGSIGESKTYTRDGLLPINTTPNVPGTDPTPQANNSVEQWTVAPQQWTGTKDTILPNSYVSIQNLVLSDARKLAIQAGTTIAHLVRNKVYNAYMGGNTKIKTTNGVASVTIAVDSTNGFSQVMVNGVPTPVSSTNPLAITINGVAANVTGVALTGGQPAGGAGTLTVAVALAVTAGQAVLATNRSLIKRVGGGTTSNGLALANKLTFSAIRAGVVALRKKHVPTYDDGTYHMHLGSDSEAQLMEDPSFEKLLTGVSDSAEWREFAIGRAAGVTFYRNEEVPLADNTNALTDYVAGDMVVGGAGDAVGAPIFRPILMGQTSVREVYIPTNAYLTESGMAPLGTLGEFSYSDDNGDAEVWLDGIRFMARPPMDRLKQKMDQTWAFEGDWGIPTDSVSIGNDMYKRAIVFEHV